MYITIQCSHITRVFKGSTVLEFRHCSGAVGNLRMRAVYRYLLTSHSRDYGSIILKVVYKCLKCLLSSKMLLNIVSDGWNGKKMGASCFIIMPGVTQRIKLKNGSDHLVGTSWTFKHPPHSLNLAPSNFRLFLNRKKHLRRQS